MPQRAAEQDHVIAMRCLGHMYITGLGVERDVFVAEQWLSKAVAKGDVEAAYLLGCLLVSQTHVHLRVSLMNR